MNRKLTLASQKAIGQFAHRMRKLTPASRINAMLVLTNRLNFCEDCGEDRCVCDIDAGIENP